MKIIIDEWTFQESKVIERNSFFSKFTQLYYNPLLFI